jgi:[phosphatase 2A protein]-leucine-carboxy methyltransferase
VPSRTQIQRRSSLLYQLKAFDPNTFHSQLSPVHANLVKYIEVDFPHITATKARRIVTNKTLLSALSPRPEGLAAGEKQYKVSQGGTRLDAEVYHLVPLDLRQHSSQPGDALSETLLPLLDPTLPTLFLAECLFCYMAPEESAAIIEWFGNVFGGDSGGGCMGVVYEMCGLE